MWHYDSETIQKVRAGDMQAAYKLYKANMPLIQKYAYRYSFIDTAISTEDLIQEAWFAVLNAALHYNSHRHNWAQALIWSLKKQYRSYMRLYRKKRPKIISLNQTVPEDETAILIDRVADLRTNSEVPALREDFNAYLRRLLFEELDERTAHTIIRHDLNMEDLHSIANSMNLSYNTTTSNRRRALLRLRHIDKIKELYQDMLEIDSATYHSSAEACALLLMNPTGVSDVKGGES